MAVIGINKIPAPEQSTRYFAELEQRALILRSMIPPEVVAEQLAIPTGYILEPPKPTPSFNLGLIAVNSSYPLQMRFQLTGAELEVREALVTCETDFELLNMAYTTPGIEHIPIFVGQATTTVLFDGGHNSFPSPHLLSTLAGVIVDSQFQQESLTQRNSVIQMLSIITSINDAR